MNRIFRNFLRSAHLNEQNYKAGFDHRPDCAVWPQDTKQVSRILSLANEHHLPVIPRGAGTGFAGGAVPIRGGVLLDFLRMNRILDIRIANRLVVVQPGVVYSDLMKALALPVMLCVERFLLIMFSQSKYLRSFVCKWRQGLAHVFFS